MQEKSLLVQFLGDSPFTKVIDFLLENRPFEASKVEVAKAVGLSRATVFKIWKILEAYDIVKEYKRYGKIKLYVLNTESNLIKDLIKLESDLIEKRAQEIAKQHKMTITEHKIALTA